MRFFLFIANTLRQLVLFGLMAWAAAALYFDLHPLVAALYLIAVVAIRVLVHCSWRTTVATVMSFLIVLTWWLSLHPSSDRPWQPDVSQTAWADIGHDQVTVHNVRNCVYRTETDYTPVWDTRTLHLSQLRGADIFINYWGSPWIAHPIVSFDFGPDGRIAFSIETRKIVGQSYSAVRGFFRQYELIYVAADERDVVRLRSNYRHEDVYLYKVNTTPQEARQRFLEYLTTLNELHSQPAWYNALTTNCTTSIRTQHAAADRAPLDWRLILNGKMDEMLYERGAFDRSLPFPELKKRARINDRAMPANDSADFSNLIRSL